MTTLNRQIAPCVTNRVAPVVASLVVLAGVAGMASASQPQPGEMVRVSVLGNGTQGNSSSQQASIDASGSKVVFLSYSSNFVPGDFNGNQSDVLVGSVQLDGLALASRSTAGQQSSAGAVPGQISGDGRYIVFSSPSNNLVANDFNGASDVFRFDTLTGVTELVSRSLSNGFGNAGSFAPSVSFDGRYVAFESTATNLSSSVGVGICIYVRDMAAGTTRLASVASDGSPANLGSAHASISGDGRYVTFDSAANNLADRDINNTRDVFLHDLVGGSTLMVSRSWDGWSGFDASYGPAQTSSDGRFVVFQSFANDIVLPDSNFSADIFLFDRETGTNERVSVNSAGDLTNFGSSVPSVSDDGRFVVWASDATNLVPGDTNAKSDVFLRDRLLGLTRRLSVEVAGVQGNGNSGRPGLTPDGRFVVFESFASNLVPGDTNGVYDVFVTQVRCPADISADGVVDFGDFLAFFNSFDAGDLNADITGDAGVDFGDFLAFFNAFDVAC